MFSGFTKELNNWLPVIKKDEISLEEKDVSEKKEEIQNDENSSKKTDENIEVKEKENANEEKVKTEVNDNNTKSKIPYFDMLGNSGKTLNDVTSQVTSWLGSANIPGMKRSGSASASVATTPNDETPVQDVGADDESSVKTKAVESAKNIGNFLYSAVNKAGQTVTEASYKIKKSVEENTIIGEFNKEQEEFIKQKQQQTSNDSSNSQQILLPWIGHPNESKLKEDILQLSRDRKNFLRSPPPGVNFEFNYNVHYQIALLILNIDDDLNEMRFQLVPKLLNEENFWKNYFYRINLILQSNELNSLDQENKDLITKNEKTMPTNEKDIIQDSSSNNANNKNKDKTNSIQDTSPTHQDFISDTFTTSNVELDEVKEEMKKLGIDYSSNNKKSENYSGSTEEDWEKELDAEIQEFEVVNDDDEDGVLDSQIESTLDQEDSK